jgi:hypothetical protein
MDNDKKLKIIPPRNSPATSLRGYFLSDEERFLRLILGESATFSVQGAF